MTHTLNSPVLFWDQTHKHSSLQDISFKMSQWSLKLSISKVSSWFSSPLDCSLFPRIPCLKECLRCTSGRLMPNTFLLHCHPSQIPAKSSLVDPFYSTSTALTGIQVPVLSHLDNWCPCVLWCRYYNSVLSTGTEAIISKQQTKPLPCFKASNGCQLLS